MKSAWLLITLGLLALASPTDARRNAMDLKSSAFAEGGPIPARYTCDGENVSPPLSWTQAPPHTKTLALIADDPDAPGKTWVHWVLFNVPPAPNRLLERTAPQKRLTSGARQGTNDFRAIGYGGPCPPSGTHRYFFKLYALDTILALEANATKDQLLQAMEGHVLEEAQLMGTYRRR